MKNIDFTDFFNVFLSGATIPGSPFLFISVYFCLYLFILLFLPMLLPQPYPGIWKRITVAGVSVEEEELILGVFLQVPVIRKLYLGIVGKTAEFLILP